jgi:predicted NAD/FAD-binding protein
MNILQHIRSKHTFNVTLNAESLIDPAKILGRFVYEHPVFTSKRSAAQARHGELLNVNRTSYCGAYWRNGFHEDGVVSAIAVCEALYKTAKVGASYRGARSIDSTRQPAAIVK